MTSTGGPDIVVDEAALETIQSHLSQAVEELGMRNFVEHASIDAGVSRVPADQVEETLARAHGDLLQFVEEYARLTTSVQGYVDNVHEALEEMIDNVGHSDALYQSNEEISRSSLDRLRFE